MSLTWNAVQEVYVPEPQEHLPRAQALGLNCPLDVFEQLFADYHDNAEFAKVVALVDWSGVAWEEGRLSGIALRRVGVPRTYQYAVNEARARTAEYGFRDEREEVMQHWLASKTWIRSPILLTSEVLQSGLQYELVVGFTRLGNLLGALAKVVAFVDWSGVTWEEGRLSGVALRRVGVPRVYQHAVDEARELTAENGFKDEREEVMRHWHTTKTWVRAPVLLAGEVLQSALQCELVVGFTRRGNLLGALDRQDVPEYAHHTVWIGRGG